MLIERESDLFRGEDQPSRGVQNDVNRHILVGQLNGAEDGLRVLDVDVANQGKSQQAQSLLAMDQRDDTALALVLQEIEQAQPLRLKHALANDRLQGGNDDKDPKEREDVHLVSSCRADHHGKCSST